VYVTGGHRYVVGEVVTLIVDPNDPDRVTLPGEDNFSPLFVGTTAVALMGGAAAACVAVVLALGARRQRLILSSAFFSIPNAGLIAGGRFQRRVPRLVIETRPEEWREVRIGSTSRRMLFPSLTSGHKLEVAEGPGRAVVLRGATSDHLCSGNLGRVVPSQELVFLDPTAPATPADLRRMRRIRRWLVALVPVAFVAAVWEAQSGEWFLSVRFALAAGATAFVLYRGRPRQRAIESSIKGSDPEAGAARRESDLRSDGLPR
jgi:hypothetical protein